MLSRRLASRAAIVSSAATAQCRAYNSQSADERWYGHHFYYDSHVYKYTKEIPKWQRPEVTQDEVKRRMETHPFIDFGGTYECLLFDAARLNEHLGRKEFTNEVQFRLEKQAQQVYRSQQIMQENKSTEEEDALIARIFDEEHVAAEVKYIKCLRANEFAEDSRLDILPGGSPSSLREKARWNTNFELHPQDRAEILDRLMAWLPAKYHIVYQDDFQTAAANDADVRGKISSIIDSVENEHKDEAKKLGYEADLKAVAEELRDDADPTRHITSAKIKASTDLNQLEEWSRAVHEYNGDGRMLEIYAKAAELTGDQDHKALVAKLQEWKSPLPDFATKK